MSDKSRVTIQVSNERSVIIHGTRNGRAIAATKAVCTDYRGYVLLLGANGKVYSPHVSGIHWADMQKVAGRQELLLRGLQQLGVVTAEEVDAAVAKGRASDEVKERRSAAWQLRHSAQTLGIKLPAALDRKLAAI